MELGRQIKKYRTALELSQEELANKIYVTRQTISNWENEKSYPDLHSLILLAALFGITLDELIKGDIKIMKETIGKNEIHKFNQDSTIFTILFLLFLVSVAPLVICFHYWGIAVSVFIYAITMYYALKLEKFKKKHDIQTYQEIVAFTEGKKLDEIAKAKESGKRPYQKILMVFAGAALGIFVMGIGTLLIWFIKR